MEPDEFLRRWNAYTVRTAGEKQKGLVTLTAAPEAPVSASTLRFLTEAGLPQDWPGTFTFDLSKNLLPLNDVYGGMGTPGDWEPEVYQRLNRYLYLGYDQGGNPICLERGDLETPEPVVFVNHERFFDPSLSGYFINSSVAQLAECVLIFSELLEAYWNEFGEEAELYEGNVPEAMKEKAMSQMRAADPAIPPEGSYWPEVLMDL